MEAAFFDLDKTVIAKASMVAFGRPLYREGLISRRILVRALYGQLIYMHLGADEQKLERMRDSVLALTKGWEQAKVREIVEETLEEVVEPIVFDEALDLINEHRAAGRRVFIVSASPEEIVAPLSRYLGVDEYLATRSTIDEQGRYAGTTEFYCYGPNKAEAIRAIASQQDIDLSSSFAYSDSATDLPMLECVGHPVVVNPDRELLREAREHEWEVRTFERKVRLRDRVPMPTAKSTTAAGSVVAAAAIGGGVWWWLHREPAHRRPPAADSRVAGVTSRVTRHAPSWPRPQQGRRVRGGEAASSWRRIIGRLPQPRS
ncbi:MAG TPA: HAD-IB family hydrolase [Acidimicrobiales bacterium]|nr:HAD-IB family hydrolase [Acidimicrobiales bacterium]